MLSESKINMNAVDLFCGCGGISVGLRTAGFQILAGVDVEKRYICTFAENFPASRSMMLDLSEVPPAQFMDDLGIQPGELGLLAGGPPCQGFSKNVPRKRRYLEDSRNLMIQTFLDYCEALQPALVLMENVAEMKNGFERAYTEELTNRLEEAGYAVSHAVLNAADYGVPQKRRRAFFIGNRLGFKLAPPAVTHAPADNLEVPNLFPLPKYVSVWDAIGDLPSIEHGEGAKETTYAVPAFSEFQKLMRNGARTVKNHIARRLRPVQFDRLAALEPGQGLKDLPAELQVKSGYSGAYGRLTKDMIAPTITRWVFHPGSGRWGHPVDTRVLSIREVARIQSFPDSFAFVGTYTQQAGQLGNAVPPLLAQRIAEAMRDQVADALASRAKNSSTVSLSVGR